MKIVALADIADTDVDALLDRAFGTDRRAKTAYRVREGLRPIAALSFAAIDGDRLLGAIQCWPVDLVCDDGIRSPMVMVGPVAVDPDTQRGGIGRALTEHMLTAADNSMLAGSDALMLIGDPEYYERFFGFTAQLTAQWRLPGPFEPRRLLARGSHVRTRPGIVGPRPLP
jgi:predicted N-acetyltransferase YhbS